MKGYKFGNKAYEHLFCGVCGSSVACRGQMGWAVNVSFASSGDGWGEEC